LQDGVFLGAKNDWSRIVMSGSWKQSFFETAISKKWRTRKKSFIGNFFGKMKSCIHKFYWEWIEYSSQEVFFWQDEKLCTFFARLIFLGAKKMTDLELLCFASLVLSSFFLNYIPEKKDWEDSGFRLKKPLPGNETHILNLDRKEQKQKQS